MALLFSPLTLKSITLKNRLVVSPMCEYSASDGFANDWHLVHLGSRAVGGSGLVLTEAAAVSPEGRISPADLGIWKNAHLEKLRSLTQFIRSQGSVAGIQLAHAGRKASVAAPWKGGKQLAADLGGWKTFAPSPFAFGRDESLPEELDSQGIEKVIADFGAAAGRAHKAGFQVLEIHAAHGYLIHQFLSPLSNQRGDGYGGSFENRIRLLMEIVAAIKLEWPADLPLLVRVSATDWAEGGWDPDQTVRLAGLLQSAGVDMLDCSSGGLVPGVKIPVGPLYQVPFAERIKKETGLLTGAVGMITTATQGEQILLQGQADLVIMAREMLRDPYFPLHAARELGVDFPWPVQYERAKPTP